MMPRARARELTQNASKHRWHRKIPLQSLHGVPKLRALERRAQNQRFFAQLDVQFRSGHGQAYLR